MSELNDKLITYGNLSTFYDKLQEQGLGGNAIEDASVLPDASENKDKLFRLDNGEKDVYVAKLLSSETITTNRLPDEQQIDKAYIYTGEIPIYYKGAYTITCSDGVLNWYLWKYNSGNMCVTADNAVNANQTTPMIGIDAESWSDITESGATTTMTMQEVEDDDTIEANGVVITATYNAPESAQIGNAYISTDDNFQCVYTGEETTIEVDGESINVYKWYNDGEGMERYSTKRASEIYYSTVVSPEGNLIISDTIFYSGEWTITSAYDGYIPQLNAPDSEQVDNAYITIEYKGTYTYKGTNKIYLYDYEHEVISDEYVEVYQWIKNNTSGTGWHESFMSLVSPSNQYGTTYVIGGLLIDDDTYYDSNSQKFVDNTNTKSDIETYLNTHKEEVEENSTVKYQRTETTEEWGWQDIIPTFASDSDIDAMFESPVVKRVLMKDSENYGYSINEGWINFNDETMSYDGGTYYKWNKYSDIGGEAVEDGGGDYFILTDTLNPTLPFDVNSNECVYDFEIEDEGETYRMESNETYSKMALIHEDGSITYEE